MNATAPVIKRIAVAQDETRGEIRRLGPCWTWTYKHMAVRVMHAWEPGPGYVVMHIGTGLLVAVFDEGRTAQRAARQLANILPADMGPFGAPWPGRRIEPPELRAAVRACVERLQEGASF